MPSIPEHYTKIDDLILYIEEYSNILPYHPDNKRTEAFIAKDIYDLKAEIDNLIKNETVELKRFVANIYMRFLDMKDTWDIDQDAHLNRHNDN